MNSIFKTTLALGCLIIIFFSCCIGSCMVILLTSSSLANNPTYYKGGFTEEVLKSGVTNKNNVISDKIAVINISGEITYSVPGSTTAAKGSTSDNIINQFEQAYKDSKVKAVILRLNTPGGEVSAGIPICDEIKRVRAIKSVYAFIDSEAASLGYFIANCTNYIYSRSTSITGSIGVIIQAVDIYGVLEKFGGKIVYLTNTNGKNKGGQQIFDENSETYKIYQKILDEDFELFLNTVADGRKDKLNKEQIRGLADGRIYSGNQASQNKLVDEIGEFDNVIDLIVKKESLTWSNTLIVEYKSLQNPFSNLFGGFSNLDFPLKSTSGMRVLMQLPDSVNQ